MYIYIYKYIEHPDYCFNPPEVPCIKPAKDFPFGAAQPTAKGATYLHRPGGKPKRNKTGPGAESFQLRKVIAMEILQ